MAKTPVRMVHRMQNAEYDELETILEEDEEEDEDPQMAVKQDVDNLDMIAYNQEELEEEPFNTAIDDTSEDPTIVMGKPVTTTFISDDVCIPTEKVGCLQVTSQLQEFLNHFPPESKEKAFEQIYQILQVLDAYLIYNLQQHLSCMSPDSEYISLIMYTTKLEIDLGNFLAIWAVLSFLLDTQNNELQYVKNLQQVVNDYYDKYPTEVMSRLEHQITDIMNEMYEEAIDLFEHTLDKTALVWFQTNRSKFKDLTMLKMMFLQRYNPWGKTKREQLQSWNILSFNLKTTDVDEHINLINTLGDMVDQKEEAKKEMFIETMPTMIQTHLITCKDWATVKDTAKSLKHIILKCDPPTLTMPMMATGATVPGLYSHIAHSVDKEEGEIPQSFKGAKPKQTRGRGKPKGKPQEQRQNPPKAQEADETYTYENPNNYYHNAPSQSQDHRPYNSQGGNQQFRESIQ